MPAFKETTVTSGLAVLPRRNAAAASHLDAHAALELSLYGATACRMTSLARLLDTDWCLTGGGWRLPQEVFADGLRAASERGTILAVETWGRSILFFYTLNPKGAQAFQELMLRPLPDWDDPISRSAATIKFGLLYVTDAEDIPAVVADLRRFYLNMRCGLADRRKSLAADRLFLRATMADRLA